MNTTDLAARFEAEREEAEDIAQGLSLLDRMSLYWEARANAFAEARDMARAGVHLGWLFHNPDTGTEWSESHPVESGECDDAERIRPGSLENLRDEMLDAWELQAERDAEQLSRAPASENERLRAALEWARSILGNMAMEHKTGWRSVFSRWPIHHEPLRSDARAVLPIIDAALENRS